jgi:hypothetical protein
MSDVHGLDDFERLQALRKRAVGCLLEDPDEARNRRLEAMDQAEVDPLEELDEAFYALPGIDGFLTAHVEAHPEQFFRA